MAPHQPRRRMGTIAPARAQLEVVRWGGRHVKRPTTTGELRGEAACYGNRVSQRARAASDFALVCPASPTGRAYVATPHMADPFLPTRLPTHTTHTQRDTWLDLLAAAAPVRGANGFTLLTGTGRDRHFVENHAPACRIRFLRGAGACRAEGGQSPLRHLPKSGGPPIVKVGCCRVRRLV